MAAPTCRAEVVRDRSDAWAACSSDLATVGIRLPLPHRAGWSLARRGAESLLVALRAPDGRCASAVGAYAATSRALPGFRVLRVERFGEAVPPPLWTAAVDGLADLARRSARVLRLTVEVFSREEETRARLGELLAQAGFARAASARNWSTTLAIDLASSERDLLASFATLARRGIRSAAKLPVQARPIDDPTLGHRLEALSRDTLRRTGGRYEALWDWGGVIELSRRAPDATRLVGLFRTDRDGPDALLGFAWGWWNGQSVSYFAGASARPKDLRGVFIGHPLMWDLITWAKRGGATWFDLGGVTDGTLGSADPLGGISDFKRLFSKETVDVAEDWVLEPHPMPARLAAVVSTGAARLVTRGRPAPHRSEAFTTPSGVPMLHAARRLAFQSVGSHALAPVLRQLGRGLVSIFTLHRFTDPEYDVVGHDPAALRDHLDYLRRHRYQLLSLSDALQRVDAGGDGWNTPAAVFTVDDGYSDFARIGAPIFAEFDCPVTLFVPTGFVDGQLWLWWDRVAYVFSHTRHCSCVLTLGVEQRPYRWSTPIERDRVQEDLLDRLQGVDTPQRDAAIACLADDLDVEIPASPPPAFAPVTWDDVRRLAERGVTFGPHTVTHPILPLASDDACTWEIQESYRRLREETEACVPVLCYPGGKAKLRELEVAQRAGFRAAVTTRPGYAAPLAVRGCGGLRRFALPRFAFPDDRPHLVNMVTGLARLRGRIRHPAL